MAADRGLMTDALRRSPLRRRSRRIDRRFVFTTATRGSGPPMLFPARRLGLRDLSVRSSGAALEARHRILIPDRTGYGGSGTLDVQRPDFHRRAAEETLAVIDALGLDRVALWGHSDGAIIALLLALLAPAAA